MSNEKNKKDIASVEVDATEYNAAMKDAESSTADYTHQLAKPFTFEGETFEELTFEFGKLTGADSLAIENEMAMLNKNVLVPEFSGEYLVRMAVRACTVKRADGRRLGIDAFRALPIGDYIRIRGRARSFLLNAGL